MEIFRLFGSIFINDDEARRNIRNVDDQAQRSSGNIAGAFKKLAGVIATAFAVDKLKDFAKSGIEAAASAVAMQSQFDQVFADMSKNATKSLNDIAKDAGMLPNRLKGSFTQMAAFAKTTGMETADALALTGRATTAAADSAAFYDRSIEAVTESLQSFLKGNYENDAALGISATETTRNAAANKLYGKSFKDLSEAQKQLTLLQMVEDGNKLSGALGQAARESEAWENQIGNLKQAWTDFKAKLMGPFLDPVVKGIKSLSEWISKIDVEKIHTGFKAVVDFFKSAFTPVFNDVKDIVQGVWDAFENAGGVEKVKGLLKGIKEGFDFVSEAVGAFYQAFMSVLYDTGEIGDILAKIGISPEDAKKVEAVFKNILDAFKKLFEGVKEVVGGVVDFIGGIIDAVKNIFNGENNIATSFLRVFSDLRELVLPVLENIVQFIKDKFAQIKTFWDENGAQIVEAVKNVFAFIASVVDFAMPYIQFVIEKAWNVIKIVISGAIDVIMGVIKVFAGLFTGDWSKLWEGIKQIVGALLKTIWGLIKQTFLGDMYNVLVSFVGKAVEKFNELKDKAKAKFEEVKDAIMTPIRKAVDFVKEQVDKIKGFFTGLSLKLPDIKTPHFKLKNWSVNPLDWVKNMPSIGVEWYARGTNFAPGGLAVVGERGPELVNLPRGSKVHTAEKTKDMLKDEEKQPVIIQVVTPEKREVARWLVEDITEFQEFKLGRFGGVGQ